jgi:hypothetical protein
MPVDDPLDRCQHNTGAVKFGHSMHTMKVTEQHTCVVQIQARAVIPHKKNRIPVLVLRPKIYHDICLFGRELPGVVQQVFEGDL